ncbi:hypothetical protein GCM10027589_24510 [Actinocorallia lasiicapitis]
MISVKRVAGAAILSAAAAVGLAAAPAEAAGEHCNLYIDPNSPVYAWVVNACTPRNSSDVLTSTVYWGSDTFEDDRLFVRSNPARNDQFYVYTNWLDEDGEQGDEIYARAWFRTPSGSTYSVKSNEVHGYWENF